MFCSQFETKLALFSWTNMLLLRHVWQNLKKMDGVRRWEMSNLVICNRFFNFSNYVKVNFLLISKIQHTFWPSKLHFRRNDTAQFFFFIKYFFKKSDQIRERNHLLKKSLMKHSTAQKTDVFH